jgi:hypothetical protein
VRLARVTALLLAAPLLGLNLARADLACASHEGAQSAPIEASQHSGHSAPATGATPSESGPCDVPAQTDCCQALVSCSTVFGANDGLLIAERSLHAGVTTATTQIPRSPAAAPDPPPPKV